MAYADGIDTYVKLGDVIMPFGYHLCPHEFQRKLYDNYAKIFPFPSSPDVSYEDENIGAGRIRKFKYLMQEPQTKKDLILYFHAGGFFMGGFESHSDIAAEICLHTHADVWLLDYPLAPEHPYPAGLEFSWQVFQKASNAQTYDHIHVAGDSSGGNMAVYIASRASKQGGVPINKVSLFCPVLNFDRWSSGGDDAPRLSGGEMEHFVRCYTEGVVRPDHRDVSPLLHHDVFDDFPETLVISAGEDSLKEDAVILTDILNAKGSKVEHYEAQGLVHACIRAKGISTATSKAFEIFWKHLS